jgi:tetratricopeptide (TPR) repeat protein
LNWIRERGIALGALFVFLVSQIVYLATLNPTCPFWDSGEYIATSYILGIPHPPGNPFYIPIGRLFTLIPIASIAARVNYLSALASSIAAVFGYLVTVEIFKWQQRGKADRLPIELGILGGIATGLFTAFSRTFWEGAVEAEVNSLSSLFVMGALWLGIRWAGEEGSTQRNNKLFVLAYYLIALSAGIHMGTYLVLPAILLFVLLVDHRTLAPHWLGAFMVAGILVGLQPAMLPNLKILWLVLLAIGILGSLLLGKFWSPLGPRGVVFWCLLLALIGLSSHLYLPIRSALHPMINEADPSNRHNLWLALIRDQYKPPNPFLYRKAAWSIQFGKHFWRYAHDQYQLNFSPRWLGAYLPYLVAAIGFVSHARRDRKTFLSLLLFYLITTVGMVFYLNFQEDEVRDRDYFFTHSYQIVAIWIGLGFATLGSWVRWAYTEGRDQFGARLGLGVAALGIVLSFSTVQRFHHVNDRSGFYLARDYAYNMLIPLEKDALVFTNGDNDTFPLWYLQEVERLRRDVRIVNLSLLNTDWYLRQLRDYSPKVDMGWNDKEIEAVRSVPEKFADYAQGFIRRDQYVSFLKANGIYKYVPNPDEFIYSKDIAARRVIERMYGKRPIYFAVTVPDQIGYTDRLTMEGLVFRMEEKHADGKDDVDVEKTMNNLENVYLYRGLLRKDGSYDASVYKDDNALRLVQNYAAGYIRSGEKLFDEGKTEEAVAAGQKAARISKAVSILYTAGALFYRCERMDLAESTFRELITEGYGEFPVLRLLGRTIERQGRQEEAEQIYLDAYARYPDEQEALREIYSYYFEQDRPLDAYKVLDTWVRRHPGDEAARKRLTALGDTLRIKGS